MGKDMISQITMYFNIGLIVLFVVLVVGLALAALRGFRRGVWKSTHNMVFMLGLVFLAFFTLTALTELVGSFNLSQFISGSLYLSREIDGQTVTYYVPITSVKETLTEFIQGFYTLFNVHASARSAANFAIALSTSVLKIILFIVEMLLIVIFGNLFSFITWFLIFRHFIPRIAQKIVKIRWLGMIETMVTFVVITFLFMTPLTSLVNSLNQSYQRNRPSSDDDTVLAIGNFVDAYNKSLFAQILFNWTVDDTGMTLDTRIFDKFTTGVSEDVTIGLVSELSNLTNLMIAAGTGIVSSEGSEFTYDPSALITKEVVDLAFDVLIESDLVNTILPVVVEVALNSDFLEEYLPGRLVDMSDVEWSKEIGYVKDMVDCVFDSGVLDNLFIEVDGKKEFRSFEGNDLVNFIDSVVNSENFDSLLDIFKSIDQSKFLSRAVPALVYYGVNSDEKGTAQQYLPLSWEELNEFSWGYECYILFDFFHKVVSVDEDFVKAIFMNSDMYEPAEGETVKSLASLIGEHANDFVSLMVGKFDADGKPVNVDKYGRTLVFENGVRKEGTNYCLFDMSVISSVLPHLLDNLFTLDAFKDMSANITEKDLVPFHQAVAELNNGVILVNYKKEFHSILDVVATVAEDEPLMDALLGGKGFESLMKEEGNFFSIDKSHAMHFKRAVSKVDNSAILYGAMTPMMKSFMRQESTDSTLYDMGIRTDVIIAGIEQDVKKENHTLFADLSTIFDSWDDLNIVSTLADSSGDSNALMDKLADQSTIDSFTHIMKLIHKNKVINPKPAKGDDFEQNENLYGLLEFVFNNTEGMGLKVTRPLMREIDDDDWDKEFDAIGKILHHVASRDIVNASSIFDDGLTSGAITKVKGTDNKDLDLPGLFRLMDDSHIFANTFGPFLDDNIGSSGLIDKENNVSYSNVKEGQWTEEGDNLYNMLDSLGTLVNESGGDFLSDFDVDKVSNISELNNMLHELAHSNMFDYVDENGVRHYQFGKWFYSKIASSLGDYTVNQGREDEKKFDLLADPAPKTNSTWDWNDEWGIRPGDAGVVDPIFNEWKAKYDNDPENPVTNTRYLAYRDFINIDGKDYNNSSEFNDIKVFWCNYADDDVDDGLPGFKSLQDKFVLDHGAQLITNTSLIPGTYENDNVYGKIFGSDQFVSDYDEIFAVDEISRIAKVLTYSMRIKQNLVPLDDIAPELLDNLLTALNNTSCMRMGIYNFYCIASDSIFKNDGGFSLANAYNPYVVDVDEEINDYDAARPIRQQELERLIEFYNAIDTVKNYEKDDADKRIYYNGNFNIKNLIKNPDLENLIKDALKGFSESYVYQRKGSSVINDNTVFQGIFKKMLTDTGDIKQVIYMAESPKDIKGVADNLYSGATDDQKATSKVEYIVTDVFKDDAAIIDAGLDMVPTKQEQKDEVDHVFNCVDDLYKMKNKDESEVSDPNNINIDTIKADSISKLLNSLNSSELLFDCVPNMMYKMFIKDKKMEIRNGTETVNFDRTDPYYHYYYDTYGTVNYDAKYTAQDIDSIENLIGDYQEFNLIKGDHDLAHRTTIGNLSVDDGVLERLLNDMHDSNIFHTPARTYDGVIPYYTSLFDKDHDTEAGTGFTLFEEMMNKLCTFVKLHDFAYDDTYADDVTNFGSATAKLHYKVDQVTLRDDAGTGHAYKTDPNVDAWPQEVDAIVKLANGASDMGTGDTLDVNSIQFDKLSPEQIDSMLTSVNDSDLVSDAVPGFIKKGFDNVGITKLSTYDYGGANEANYNYYRLGQVNYGLYEIDSIGEVMESIAVRDPGTHEFIGYIENFGSLNVKNLEDRTVAGLVKYIYRSRILNTNAEDPNNVVYNALHVNSGEQVGAQGILFYNALGNDLTGYIARDSANTPKTTLEKISSLSKLVHFQTTDELSGEPLAYDDIGYEVESQAIVTMVAQTKTGGAEVDASSFNNINDIKTRKTVIKNIIRAAYDADGDTSANEERSYIVSEFSAGLLNTVFDTEYDKIDTYGYAYNSGYSFGENDAANITRSSYDEINEIEYNGVDGILSMIDYLATVKTDATSQEKVRDNFALMGAQPGENSMFGRVIYLAEAHNTFTTIPGFAYADTTSCNPLDSNNVYSNDFCFADYGESLYTFLHP